MILCDLSSVFEERFSKTNIEDTPDYDKKECHLHVFGRKQHVL